MMSTSITRRRRYLLKDAGKYRESICPMGFCIRFTTRMQLACSTSRPANKALQYSKTATKELPGRPCHAKELNDTTCHLVRPARFGRGDSGICPERHCGCTAG